VLNSKSNTKEVYVEKTAAKQVLAAVNH
jgi:hypothetical protein